MTKAMRRHDAVVRIRRTRLGRGVFSRQRFRSHQVIGVVRGRVIVDVDHTSDYCMDLGDDRSLEPAAPFRFLNHSCEPNCELFYWETDDPSPRDRLWLQALRPIQPGEELTIDYAWPANDAIPCACGAAGCRGWIVSAEELTLV